MKLTQYFHQFLIIVFLSHLVSAQIYAASADLQSSTTLQSKLPIDENVGSENIAKLSGEGTKSCPYIGYTSIEVFVQENEKLSETSFRTYAVASNGAKVQVAENNIIPGKQTYIVEFLAGTCTTNIVIEKQK